MYKGWLKLCETHWCILKYGRAMKLWFFPLVAVHNSVTNVIQKTIDGFWVFPPTLFVLHSVKVSSDTTLYFKQRSLLVKDKEESICLIWRSGWFRCIKGRMSKSKNKGRMSKSKNKSCCIKKKVSVKNLECWNGWVYII